MAETDRPKITIYYGAYDLHAAYLRVQTHIQNM